MQLLLEHTQHKNPVQSPLHRVMALVLVVSTSAILAMAMALDPDPAGTGTHRQLGLPPCGVLVATGLPCATCGMTTAFAWAVRGRLLTALIVQPAGALLAIVTMMGTLTGFYAMLVGLPLGPTAKWLWRPATVLLLGAVVIVSWGYKCLMILGDIQI